MKGICTGNCLHLLCYRIPQHVHRGESRTDCIWIRTFHEIIGRIRQRLTHHKSSSWLRRPLKWSLHGSMKRVGGQTVLNRTVHSGMMSINNLHLSQWLHLLIYCAGGHLFSYKTAKKTVTQLKSATKSPSRWRSRNFKITSNFISEIPKSWQVQAHWVCRKTGLMSDWMTLINHSVVLLQADSANAA